MPYVYRWHYTHIETKANARIAQIAALTPVVAQIAALTPVVTGCLLPVVYMKVILLNVAALLFLFLGATLNFGQVSKPAQNQHSLSYKVVSSQYVDKTFLLIVVIKPEFLNCKDMIILAKDIKNDFSTENELEAVFFINKSAAKNFSLNQHSKDYEKNKEAFRGSYRLNRVTVEELLTYAPIGRRAIEREEIDLSKEESSRCSSRSGSK